MIQTPTMSVRKQIKGAARSFMLQSVLEPCLFRDVFPIGQMPRIVLGNEVFPINPAETAWITDTTFRDGQQALPPFTVDQIVHLYKLMHKLDGGSGLIRQSEFFLYTKKDREAVNACRDLGFEFPEIIGWIRALESDFQLVKDAGIKETGILTSVSDYQIFLKLGWTREQAMKNYLRIVQMCLDNGIVPSCNLEDTTRADIYGFVIPFVSELMKLADRYQMPVKIRPCDTLGFGVDIAGAALPRSVQGIVHALRELAGVPSEWLEWHGHNDFYRGLTNASTAWLHGCSAANGTWLGIGERTGNTPIEALILEFLSTRGSEGIETVDTTVITEISNYMQHEMGVEVPEKQPFVGANFNRTKAGIHADGLLKHPEIYNAFDTEGVLKRPPTVSITDKSGVAGIAFWINDHFHIPGEEKVSKTHSGVMKIKHLIDGLYDSGRIAAISTEEMLEMIEEIMPEIMAKYAI